MSAQPHERCPRAAGLLWALRRRLLVALLAAVLVPVAGAQDTQPTVPPLAQRDPTVPRVRKLSAGGVSPTEIEVRWLHPNTQDSFLVERLKSETEPGGSEKVVEVGAGGRTFRDTGLASGRMYFYRVFTRRGDRFSHAEGIARGTVLGDFVIAEPDAGERVESLRPQIKWTTVPGATSYDVSVEDPAADDPAKKTVYSRQFGAADLWPRVRRGALEINRKYEVNVTAATPDGQVDALNNGQAFHTPQTSLFGFFTENHLTLRRSFEGDDSAESALFGYSKDAKVVIDEQTQQRSTAHSETANFQFALIYAPPLDGEPHASPVAWSGLAAVEGKLSNTDFEAADALRLRLGAVLDTYQRGAAIQSTYTTAALKYETDQDFDTQKLVAEVRWTPTIPSLVVGSARRVPLVPGAYWYWRPTLGLDAGRTLETGESQETEDTVLRLVGQVKAKLLFPTLADLLELNELSLFADNTSYYLPLEDGEEFHNYLEAGIELKLTENVSIDLLYKVGEDSPDFLKLESLGVSLGLQF